MTVVVTRSIPEAGLEKLRSLHDVRLCDFGTEPVTEEMLIEAGREAEALLTLLSDPVTARVMDGCPRLKVIAQYAVGYDNIDLEAARERGIVVTHTPGVLTDATADLAFALLLGAARRIVEADRFVREGRFKRWETDALLGLELRGRTLGIVGMGRIGEAMARRALGFGMQIIYHNRRRANWTTERILGARLVTFDELLAESDVISIHSSLNPASRGLFDAAAFEKMRRHAILINTARGPIVDEAALVAALEQGQIAGAGLDVFEEEPRVHPGLLASDRVVLAPHLGSATVETRTRMAEMCAEAIAAALSASADVPYRLV